MTGLAQVMRETQRVKGERMKAIATHIAAELTKYEVVDNAMVVNHEGTTEPTLTVRIADTWFDFHMTAMYVGSRDNNGMKTAFIRCRASAEVALASE